MSNFIYLGNGFEIEAWADRQTDVTRIKVRKWSEDGKKKKGFIFKIVDEIGMEEIPPGGEYPVVYVAPEQDVLSQAQRTGSVLRHAREVLLGTLSNLELYVRRLERFSERKDAE